MKKLILGATMFITGFIGVAILIAATLSCNYTLNGSNNYADIWRLFGITPFVIAFAVLGIVGLLLAIWSLFTNR